MEICDCHHFAHSYLMTQEVATIAVNFFLNMSFHFEVFEWTMAETVV